MLSSPLPGRVPRRSARFPFVVLGALLAVSSLALPQASALTPTFVTDKPNYLPNETVHITGTGYDAGAIYDIPVRRPDGTVVKGDGSFAPGWDSTVASSSGALAYDYRLDGVYGLYEARVYPEAWAGDWSQAPLARVTFFDANVNLDQCANDEPGTPPCAWQNGNLNGNNSAYAEGDVVPFRLAVEDLTAGEHTIHLNYDFTSGGHKAYDFLATYDATEAVDVCSPGGGGVSSLCPALPVPDTEAFPSDGTVVDTLAISGAEAAFGGSRDLTMWGGTITSITPADPVHAGPTDGNSSADLLVTFQATGDAVLLAWGGHIAASAYWNGPGDPDGAGQINGAPWHMRTQFLDGSGAANQDRSIQPSSLIATQSLTIVKDTLPDGPADFGFSGVEGAFEPFVLDDDDDDTLPNSVTLAVEAGVYPVLELGAVGFDLTAIECDDPSGGTEIDLELRQARLDVAEGENVTCTYTNVQRGSLTVVKDTVPDGPPDFSFVGDGVNGGAAFELDDDDDLTLPQSRTFEVVPGIYRIQELTTAGYELTTISCSDDDSTGDLGSAVATYRVAPGESVTCTFRNEAEVVYGLDPVDDDDGYGDDPYGYGGPDGSGGDDSPFVDDPLTERSGTPVASVGLIPSPEVLGETVSQNPVDDSGAAGAGVGAGWTGNDGLDGGDSADTSADTSVAAAGDATGGHPHLPRTGAGHVGHEVRLALALLAAGSLVMAFSRRRRTTA